MVRVTAANGGKWQNAYCACPEGSGLILNRDGKICTKELSPASCGESEWSCERGKKQCIPIQWRCDGNSECSDHSDEIGCPKCGVGRFKCTNGDCINATLICDGTYDCIDNSDEVNCCGPNMFQCKSTKKCIDEADICNDVKDCDDGSDEYLPQCTKSPQQPLTNIPVVDQKADLVWIPILIIAFILIIAIVSLISYK